MRIEGTQIESPTRMVAHLSGAAKGDAVVERKGRRFFFTEPGGRPKAVPADSLMDCLHYSVYWMKRGRKET